MFLARHNGPFSFLEGEDPAAFEALKAGFVAEYQPATTTEGILLLTMAESHWLSQRAGFEAQKRKEAELALKNQMAAIHKQINMEEKLMKTP